MYGARRRGTRKKNRLLHGSAAVLVTAAVLLYLIHVSIRPIITTISGNQARILCNSIINNTVLEQIGNLGVGYDDLASFIYDPAGNIAAIETNAMALSSLRARVTEAVNTAIESLGTQNIRIPLGTLTGIEILSGRGPAIPLKMVPSSYVESTLLSNFDSAGINQPRHMIVIEFKLEMTAVLAPYTTTVSVVSDIIVAETILIGTVPNFYAVMDGI